MKAIITVGVSASGKTTWARQQGCPVVCRDDIRREILVERLGRALEPGELWKRWRFKGADEKEVTKRYDEQLALAAAAGQDVICADTHLSKKFRAEVTTKLRKLGYEVEVKDFPVSLEEAWKRDAGRQDGVGHSVVYNQYQRWLEYTERRRYRNDPKLPNAVIVDVDGTLAHMTTRGPFEWTRVREDSIRAHVRDIVKGLYARPDQETRIIVVSGRDGVCYDDTEQWLKDNDVPFDELLMRAAGDMRADTIIKEEIFWRDIAPHFNVTMAIDDRPSVCRMWMALGLNVVNVGNPFVEF